MSDLLSLSLSFPSIVLFFPVESKLSIAFPNIKGSLALYVVKKIKVAT